MDVLALINQNYLLNGAGLWEHHSCNGYISKKTEGINFCWMNRPWAALLVSVVCNIHTVLMKRFPSKCYVFAICFPLCNPLQVRFCLSWYSFKKTTKEKQNKNWIYWLFTWVAHSCGSAGILPQLQSVAPNVFQMCPNRTPSTVICAIHGTEHTKRIHQSVNGINRIEIYFRTQL